MVFHIFPGTSLHSTFKTRVITYSFLTLILDLIVVFVLIKKYGLFSLNFHEVSSRLKKESLSFLTLSETQGR